MGKLRVAVIGAGAAGLCSARYLLAQPDFFDFVVYEKSDRVGGTWVYTEETGTDKYGLPIHSSMYPSLITNLPKEIMAFPDLPFDSILPSFIKHSDVLAYLQQYTDHFGVEKHIKFFTAVESVKPINFDSKSVRWEIGILDVRDGKRTTAQFDAVIVCNGHYSAPHIPDLPGQKAFIGRLLHSHNYRHPTDFKDQSVVVLGAASSGLDVLLDVAPHAKQMYLSHWRERVVAPLPDNILQTKEIASFTEDEVVFADGERCRADAVIFCTGYHFDFSFLTQECKVHVDDRHILSLYKHCLHTSFPSMAFIGITKQVLPFPHFTAQVKFVLASWSGVHTLPSKADMDKETEEEYRWRRNTEKLPHRRAHFMGSFMREYHKDLLELAKEEQFKPVLMNLYEEMYRIRRVNLMHYKALDFQVLDDKSFKQLNDN